MDVLMCKFNSKTARFGLSKKRIAELFGVDVRTVNEHLQNIFKSGELEKEATIRKIRIVQQEGSGEVSEEFKTNIISQTLIGK